MGRHKSGKSGELGRAEAAGAIIVICLYVFSMLGAIGRDLELFMTQLFYFSLITFILVAMILAFDRLTLESVRISKHVLAGVVLASVAMAAFVNFIVVNPGILQIAAFSSITPTAGLVIYQLFFIGVGEGILHFFLIRLSYSAVKNWGLAILVGSGILGAMHIYAVGIVPLTIIFLALIFIIFAGLSMSPALLGGKVKFSLIISATVHMIYNICLITMSGAVAT